MLFSTSGRCVMQFEEKFKLILFGNIIQDSLFMEIGLNKYLNETLQLHFFCA